MIENALLMIIELLFCGIVGVTIINIVLVSIIYWLLHKQ